MASRYRWRQELLGSLQGQLQLATYLVVFLGFTGASSVGLLIGQRNLLANDKQFARQSIALCDKAIRGLQDDPARLEQELLFHSNANTSLWIEDNSGSLLRHHIHQSLSDAAIQTAMATNPGAFLEDANEIRAKLICPRTFDSSIRTERYKSRNYS